MRIRSTLHLTAMATVGLVGASCQGPSNPVETTAAAAVAVTPAAVGPAAGTSDLTLTLVHTANVMGELEPCG